MIEKVQRRLAAYSQNASLVSVAVFLFLFLYAAIWIWQGLDVTDNGFDLTNQVTVLRHDDSYEYERLTWFSDVAGGLWLVVLPSASVLWARLGWALLIALTGYAAYQILASYYPRVKAALSVAAVALASIFYAKVVVDYNNVPAFLLVVATGLILASQRLSLSVTRPGLAAFGAGVLLSLAILARLPLLPAILIPFIGPIVVSVYRRSSPRPAWGRAFMATAGLAAGLLLGALLLRSMGQLGYYLTGVQHSLVDSPYSGDHSIAELLRLYRDDLIVSSGRGALFILASGLVASLLIWLRRYNWPAKAGQLSFGLFIIGLFVFFRGYFVLLPGISIVLALTTLALAFAAGPLSDEKLDRLVLLVAAGYIAALAFIGSNTGILPIRFALWLLLPATFLLLPEALEALWLRMGRAPHPEVGRYVMIGLFALGFVGFMYQFSGPYRDSSNRFRLTEAVDAPGLRGIFTTAGRAESLEQLMRALDQYLEPGDPLLAYNSIPLLYYVTGTIPSLRQPWPTHLSTAELTARLEQVEGTPVAVRATTNTRHVDWGGRPVPQIQYDLLDDNLRLIDDWLDANGYLKAWSNEDFEILIPASGR